MKICDRLILVFLFLGMATALIAEDRELKTDTTEAVDAVLVLDSSGSMLLNDPLRLRYEGARLFLQFLKPGDRLAVVSFAEQAAVVRPLTPFDASQSESVYTILSQIQAKGQYTDLLAGIQAAADILRKDITSAAKPLIVLLSDGKMDPAPAVGGAEQLTDKLMNELLPDLKAQGMRVYTLAFSEDVDKALLSQIAASTDGVQWFTPSADKVHESFAELFLAVKKPQVVPISAKGFVIDGNVQEATFYVNREGESDVYLKAPYGLQIRSNSADPNVKWFRGQKFDVITIVKPEIGSWQIFGISPNEGFATILTNLKLVSDWPSHIEAGTEALLQARLYEDKKPVSLPEMTGASRFAFQITPTDKVAEPIVREFLVDDGSKGDKIPGDGIFSFQVKLEDAGEYRLRILAKAPTFERQQQIPFRVKPPLVSISIESSHAQHGEEGVHEAGGHKSGASDAHGGDEQSHDEHGHGQHHEHSDATQQHGADDGKKAAGKNGSGEAEGNEQSRIVITLSDEALTLRNIQVKLAAVDSNRQRYTIMAQRGHDALTYEVPAAALPADGTYTLVATLSGEAKQKKSVKEDSRPLKFTRHTEGESTPEVMVKVVEEKKEEPQAFPLVELLIVSAVNILSFLAVFTLLKRLKSGSADKEPIPPVPDTVFQGIAALEQKLSMTEINLMDPFFSDGSLSAPAVEAASAAAAPESKGQAQPAPETEANEAATEPAPEEGAASPEAEQEESAQ